MTAGSKKFNPTPPTDGAFICRNNLGPGWGENGYFYISYHDQLFARKLPLAQFYGAEAITNYGSIYQYDPLGWTASLRFNNNTGFFANVYTAKSSEQLKAVSFYSASNNSAYTIYVYKNVSSGPQGGTLAMIQSGTVPIAGYHTIPLASPVTLAAEKKFSVVVRQVTPGYNYPIPIEYPYDGYSSKATANAGESFISNNGRSWMDLTSTYVNSNVCLKAFTSTYYTGTIFGKITDSGKGTGIDGAQVYASGQSVISSGGGYYTLNNVGSGSQVVTVSKSGYQTAAVRVNVPEGGSVKADIALALMPPAGTVTGRITDKEKGIGIGGATVSIGGRSVATRGGGEYTITRVPIGKQTMTVSKPAYRTGTATVTVTADSTVTADMELTFSPTVGVVTGRVTDKANGRGIDGALVNVDGRSTTTVGGGYYTINDVHNGSKLVTASKNGYQSGSVKVTIAAGRTVTANLEIGFSPARGTIKGMVYDFYNGAGINGATVSAGEKSVATSGGGYFILKDAGTGNQALTASKKGYKTYSTMVNVIEGATIDCNISLIPSRGNVKGRVYDLNSGDGIDGASVTIDGVSIITSGGGYFTLGSICSGYQTLTASKKGYKAYSTTVNVIEGATIECLIPLTSSTGNIKGRVYDSNNGAGIDGVSVTIEEVSAITSSGGLCQNFALSFLILKAGSLDARDAQEATRLLTRGGYTLKDLWLPESREHSLTQAELAVVRSNPQGQNIPNIIENADCACSGEKVEDGQSSFTSPEECNDRSGVIRKRQNSHIRKFEDPFDPVEKRVFSPGESFWKTIKHIMFISPHGSAIFAIVILLSLFLLIKEVSAPPRKITPRDTCSKISIIVRGKFRPAESVIHAGFGSNPIKMCFHFPELPLDIEKLGTFSQILENNAGDGRYCSITPQGDFEARFSFKSRKMPGYFCLKVRGRSIQEKTPSNAQFLISCFYPPVGMKELICRGYLHLSGRKGNSERIGCQRETGA